MNLDLRDLRYFRSIAELGHLGRAAAHVGRSQPALTKSVDRLEAAVGLPLLERKGRGVELTPVGRVLLDQSRQLLAVADNSFRQIRELALGQTGHVRIGSGPITAEHLLPQICALVLAEAPGVTIEVTVGTYHILHQQLKSGEIDFVVGIVTERHRGFAAHPLMEDVVVAAAGDSHPIFQVKRPTMKHLLDYGWVLPIAAVASRQWLDRAFQAHGLPAPRAQIEVNSIPTLAKLIGRTDLLCFVSRFTLADRPSFPLREINLEATTLTRNLGVTYSTSQLSPAAAKVVKLLRKKWNWASE